MTEFPVEAVVGNENRIVTVKHPTGTEYLSLVTTLSRLDDEPSPKVEARVYKSLIISCTDIDSDEFELMAPRALSKIMKACEYALMEKVPEPEDIEPEDFGTSSLEGIL